MMSIWYVVVLEYHVLFYWGCVVVPGTLFCKALSLYELIHCTLEPFEDNFR